MLVFWLEILALFLTTYWHPCHPSGHYPLHIPTISMLICKDMLTFIGFFPSTGCYVLLPHFTMDLRNFLLPLHLESASDNMSFEGPSGGLDDQYPMILNRNGTPYPMWVSAKWNGKAEEGIGTGLLSPVPSRVSPISVSWSPALLTIDLVTSALNFPCPSFSSWFPATRSSWSPSSSPASSSPSSIN